MGEVQKSEDQTCTSSFNNRKCCIKLLTYKTVYDKATHKITESCLYLKDIREGQRGDPADPHTVVQECPTWLPRRHLYVILNNKGVRSDLVQRPHSTSNLCEDTLSLVRFC